MPFAETESDPQRVEVGTFIRVLPNLTPDNKNVRLDFEWELREVRGFEQQVGPDNKKRLIPLLAVDSIKTTAVVPDGKTLLIGGKKIHCESSGTTKRPVLGDLPLIGGLFRSAYKITSTRNVLILIKPTINPQKPVVTPPTQPPPGLDSQRLRKLLEKFESSAVPK